MNTSAGLLLVASLALSCGSPVVLGASPPQDPIVLAQGLKKLEASPRIDAVLWTRRATLCTVQVILPSPVYGMRTVRGEVPQGLLKPPAPMKLQVWLLRADGTAIQPTGRWESAGFNASRVAPRAPGPEVQFGFPLSSATEAVAAAMMVDGEFYIQQLEPFAKPGL